MTKVMSNLRRRGYLTMLWLFMGLALFLMVLIYGIFYLLYYQKSLAELQEKNHLVMQVAEKDVDSQIRAMSQITQSLWREYDVLAALTSESPYDSYKLNQRLSSFTSTNGSLLDIAIYDSYSHYMYCSSGAVDPHRYFSTYADLGRDPETLLELVRQAGEPALYGTLSARILRLTGTYDVVMYIDPISESRKVVYIVDKQALVSPMENMLQDQEGVFFVLNAKGEPILSMGINREDPAPEELEAWEFPSFPEGAGEIAVDVKDGAIHLASKSSVSTFRYVIYTHPSVFLGGMRTLRVIFATSLGLLIVLGVAASLLFSRVSHAPIRQLQDALQLPPGDEPPATGWRDLDGITARFQEIQANLEQTEKRLQTDRDFLYSSLVCGLINSTSAYYFNQAAYRQAAIDLSGRWTQVALLQADSYPPAMLDTLRGTAADSDVACYLSHKNEYDRLIIVLNGQEKPALVRVVQSISERLEEVGTDFFIGVGQAVEEVHLARLSFSQAFAMLREASGGEPAGGHRVAFHRGTPRESSRGHFRSAQPRLHEAILARDMQAVEEIVRSLFQQAEDQTTHSFLFSDVIYFLLVTARAEDAPDTGIANALYTVNRDSEGMVDSLLYLSRSLCEALPQAPAATTDPFAEQVTAYIRERYTDNSLSVQGIAEHFSVSPSHLNRSVKAATGKTVFAILDGMRMDHAMSLVAESSLSIKEIVDRSGYGDVNYFTKKFKRTTGMTPGQYRRIQRDQ